MRRSKATLLTLTLLGSGVGWAGQQQSPPANTTTQSQDVPHQHPGTDNPDVSKQVVPKPSSSSEKISGKDVPQQQPGPESPDMAKGRQTAPSGTGAARHRSRRKKKSSGTTA